MNASSDALGATPKAVFSSLSLLSFLLITVLSLSLFSGTLAEQRKITFAKREWYVRSVPGSPPRNTRNEWDDTSQSVWTDSEGLHLKIRKIEGVWHCAEVYTVLPTTYGMHRFYIASRVDSLDPNVVASVFLYKDDNHEIDIEFSKWGSSQFAPSNAQYVVQPEPYTIGNKHTFNIALNGDYSTHYIDWQSSEIRFKSFHGHYLEPPNPFYQIQSWTYAGAKNPLVAELLYIHINLWLLDPLNPSGRESELIVKDADLPPIPPQSLRIVKTSN